MCTSHAEKRCRFNERFKDVLVLKGEYDGHVKQAEMVKATARKYKEKYHKHIRASKGG
jgi:hypothetical protein